MEREREKKVRNYCLYREGTPPRTIYFEKWREKLFFLFSFVCFFFSFYLWSKNHQNFLFRCYFSLTPPTYIYFFLRGGNPKNVTWCVEDRKRMKNARTRKSRTATLYIWLRYYRKYFRVCTYNIMMCVSVCMVFFFRAVQCRREKRGEREETKKENKKENKKEDGVAGAYDWPAHLKQPRYNKERMQTQWQWPTNQSV